MTERAIERHATELIRFVAVGGFGALLYVALSTAALAVLPQPAAVIAIATHAALILPMFALQRTVTFQSTGAPVREFLKYAALQLASITITSLLFARLTTADWRLNALVFAVISASSALLSFAVCKAGIFERNPPQSQGPAGLSASRPPSPVPAHEAGPR